MSKNYARYFKDPNEMNSIIGKMPIKGELLTKEAIELRDKIAISMMPVESFWQMLASVAVICFGLFLSIKLNNIWGEVLIWITVIGGLLFLATSNKRIFRNSYRFADEIMALRNKDLNS
jgi:tellurite resistance protein TehA-like permease